MEYQHRPAGSNGFNHCLLSINMLVFSLNSTFKSSSFFIFSSDFFLNWLQKGSINDKSMDYILD